MANLKQLFGPEKITDFSRNLPLGWNRLPKRSVFLRTDCFAVKSIFRSVPVFLVLAHIAFRVSRPIDDHCKKNLLHWVESRFNEVPSDWGNLFVISRVCYSRTPHLHLTNFLEFSGKLPKRFVISRYNFKTQRFRIRKNYYLYHDISLPSYT